MTTDVASIVETQVLKLPVPFHELMQPCLSNSGCAQLASWADQDEIDIMLLAQSLADAAKGLLKIAVRRGLASEEILAASSLTEEGYQALVQTARRAQKVEPILARVAASGSKVVDVTPKDIAAMPKTILSAASGKASAVGPELVGAGGLPGVVGAPVSGGTGIVAAGQASTVGEGSTAAEEEFGQAAAHAQPPRSGSITTQIEGLFTKTEPAAGETVVKGAAGGLDTGGAATPGVSQEAGQSILEQAKKIATADPENPGYYQALKAGKTVTGLGEVEGGTAEQIAAETRPLVPEVASRIATWVGVPGAEGGSEGAAAISEGGESSGGTSPSWMSDSMSVIAAARRGEAAVKGAASGLERTSSVASSSTAPSDISIKSLGSATAKWPLGIEAVPSEASEGGVEVEPASKESSAIFERAQGLAASGQGYYQAVPEASRMAGAQAARGIAPAIADASSTPISSSVISDPTAMLGMFAQ